MTREQVYPEPLELDIEVLPSREEDRTDELDEIEEALGVDPHWKPDL